MRIKLLFIMLCLFTEMLFGKSEISKRHVKEIDPAKTDHITSASWSKKVQQGFSMKLWLSTQLAMGKEAWDPLNVPVGDCTIGIGLDYPALPSSCIEHLFGAAPKVGAIVNGVRRVSEGYNVSTASMDFVPQRKDTARDRIWQTSISNLGEPNKRGIDDDVDGKIDEDELDGLDNDGDWNLTLDDLGTDGLPDSLETGCKGAFNPITNTDPAFDNYDPAEFDSCHADINTGFPRRKSDKNVYTEQNGIPDHGEPNVDEDYGAISNTDLSLGVTDTASTFNPSHVPIGVKIWQKSYAWSGRDGMIFLDYSIVDIGSNNWQDVYVAMSADMDIGPIGTVGYFQHNFAAYDSASHTLYTHNPVDAGSTPLGITFLGASKPIDSLRFISQWGGLGDFDGSDSLSYEALNGDRFGGQLIKPNQNPDSLSDVNVFMSIGPFQVQPGDSIHVRFAFVSGATVTAMLAHAVQARAIYDNNFVLAVRESPSARPLTSSLHQNYPNPFNPSTEFKFRVEEYGPVSLKIHDVLGREVATIVQEELSPGEYSCTWNAGSFPSGVYYYKLETHRFTDVKKMILLK